MSAAPLPLLNHVAKKAAVLGALLLALAGCAPAGSVTDADVPAWQSTVLPEASGSVLSGSGKILNRDPIAHDRRQVEPGTYTLSMVCDGGGKAYFAVTSQDRQIADAGAACNGSLERYRLKVPASGSVGVTVSSVDAPLIYAFNMVPES
jgi:hypothetical protein